MISGGGSIRFEIDDFRDERRLVPSEALCVAAPSSKIEDCLVEREVDGVYAASGSFRELERDSDANPLLMAARRYGVFTLGGGVKLFTLWGLAAGVLFLEGVAVVAIGAGCLGVPSNLATDW